MTAVERQAAAVGGGGESAGLAAAARADLAAVLPAAPAEADDRVVLSGEQAARVWAAVDASTAANTKAAYRSDWARFLAWCEREGYGALPADPLVVAAYVTEAAALQRSDGRFAFAPATVTRWVSSINQLHTAAGHPAPGRSEVVRRALAGIRRVRATPPRRRAPLLLADIRTLLDSMSKQFGAWPAGVGARRDATLLLMGFASALRRSELVALRVADVTRHPVDGLHLLIRSSKTDPQAHGAVVAVPYGRDPVTCPPCAYVRWRELCEAADSTDPNEPRAQRRTLMTVVRLQARADPAEHVCGRDHPAASDSQAPVFRTLHKTGRIQPGGMSGDAVNQVLARRASAAGYPADRIDLLGGHSLRSGFVTEAFRQGADAHAIMRQTRHRNPAQLETYAREHAPLVGNAVTRIGL